MSCGNKGKPEESTCTTVSENRSHGNDDIGVKSTTLVSQSQISKLAIRHTLCSMQSNAHCWIRTNGTIDSVLNLYHCTNGYL